MEAAEKDAKAKYGQTKSRLLETEDTVIGLKASVKQLEGQLEDSKTVKLMSYVGIILFKSGSLRFSKSQIYRMHPKG